MLVAGLLLPGLLPCYLAQVRGNLMAVGEQEGGQDSLNEKENSQLIWVHPLGGSSKA